MATYAKPQGRQNEKSGRLRGEGDEIKFIDLRVDISEVGNHTLL